MSAEQIYFYTAVWLAIAVTLVIVTAALLITIIVLARKIAELAGVALEVVEDIEHNTKPIWQLNATNKVAGNLLAGAKAIEANAGAIVGAMVAADKKKSGVVDKESSEPDKKIGVA
ncbi:MAG: hypothetical protein DSY87_07780 [Methylococcus sp.]|nr:MAG: hypothetical protein DSY87_07780 [Methylococcus sp.]